MNDDELSALYHLCFPNDARPWEARSFREFRHDKYTDILIHPQAALLSRTIADQSEILTIFVHPSEQNKGVGSAMMRTFLEQSENRGVKSIYLEVAKSNQSAIRLYQKFGFRKTGLRTRYYLRKDGQREDAVLMGRV